VPPAAFTSLLVEDLPLELVRKPVRRLRLRVCAPHGQVRVTAPVRTPVATIQAFVQQHHAWIQQQQARLRQLPLPPTLSYETGETHYYQGQALHLVVHEQTGGRAGQVTLALNTAELHLRVVAGTSVAQRAQVMTRWRRQQLHALIPVLLAKWEPIVGAQATAWGVKQMKTRWGTCSIRARRIWLSLALSEWPLACLEYVVVHELTHLHERLHNARFWHLVGQAMPAWQTPHRALRQGDLAALVSQRPASVLP
jgi:predicted metal-dependent hydrolase